MIGKKRWSACDVEEEYLGEDRKASKQERKRMQEKDRSKYKKTERPKSAPPSNPLLPIGRVLAISSQSVEVESQQHIYKCSLRGLLKKEFRDVKNLVIVGDSVRFEPLNETEGVIDSIEPRRSVLSRADNLSRRKEQLIAANIDQVLITVSAVFPALKPYIVDRYVIAAEKGHMDPVVILNKIDLLSQGTAEEQELVEAFIKSYEALQIPVIAVSVVTGEGMEKLKAVMKDKTSVFSGQSGVGKSSLINALSGTSLPIGNPVEKTGKGSHTTTRAQLLPLQEGGFVIDTPGIKSFGVWDLDKEQLQNYFDDLFAVGRGCRFPNCSHTGEEGCAVLKAVEGGTLSALRYGSYLTLLGSLEETHKRR